LRAGDGRRELPLPVGRFRRTAAQSLHFARARPVVYTATTARNRGGGGVMRFLTKLVVLFALSTSLSALAAEAQTRKSSPRIANALETQQFPSVGYFLIQTFGGTGFCSGTLIGCNTFLTAAHCVCTDSSGNTLTGSQCLKRPDLLDPTGKFV